MRCSVKCTIIERAEKTCIADALSRIATISRPQTISATSKVKSISASDNFNE